MGFSGGWLVARCSGPLLDAMESAGYTGIDPGHPQNLGLHWHSAPFDACSRHDTSVLVRATGAPVLEVVYHDSDMGFVLGETPDGAVWEGLLNRNTAERYDVPLDRFPVEPAVAGALHWSAAAGLTANEQAIRRALLGNETFAEDLGWLLAAGLGVPGARPS